MLNVQTPDQVQATRDKEDAERRATQIDDDVVADAIAAHVHKCWNQAKFSRQLLTERLLDCLRRKKGVYSSTKLAEIKATGGSEIYMKLTAAKCRAAKAWLSDLFNPSGDRPWVLEPTPVPELPDSLKRRLVAEAVQHGINKGLDVTEIKTLVAQHRDRLLDELRTMAEERAEKMSEKIEDILTEGGWREEFDKFLDDFTTFPYAVIRGLQFVEKRQISWVDLGNGEFVPKIQRVIAKTVRRVDPFRFYPSPSVSDTLVGHWCIEHHRYTRSDLAGMRKSPGYRADSIAKVLAQYASGGLREWMFEDGERELIEGKQHNYQSDEIDGIEWSGYMQGQTLIDNGVSPKLIPDPLDEYQVSVEVIGGYTIRALINPDPTGKPDYHFASWDPIPGSFSGNALPELMSDQQDMCNASARALSNNMGMSAIPQVWIETDRLAEGQDVHSMYPGKVWQSSSSSSGSKEGVGFFQPQSNAQVLMMVYERFSRYADEIVGLPAYAYGSDNGAGAAKTARGLGMLMNAASKTVKQGVRNVDIRIIEQVVEKAFMIEMLTGDDPSIKGDAVAKARGSVALLHKEEAAVRAQSILQSTANPVDQKILGVEGRHELLREMFRNSDMPVDRIMPSLEELKDRLMAEQQAAQQQQGAPTNGIAHQPS